MRGDDNLRGDNEEAEEFHDACEFLDEWFPKNKSSFDDSFEDNFDSLFKVEIYREY